MSQWSFVASAYAVMLLLTAGLLAWAFAAMHRAESVADALQRRD